MHTNSYLQIKGYFQQITAAHHELQTFSGFISRELSEKKKSYDGIQSPFISLIKYRLMIDPNKQNNTGIRRVEFGIAMEGIDANDFEAQHIAINECERIAKEVLSRIKYDNHKRDHFLFNSFPDSPVTILPVALSLNAYGVEVILDLKNKESLKLNPAHWSDIDTVC